jgi:hypothetical protein
MFVSVQLPMKSARILACTLATCLLSVSLSAQQAAIAEVADPLVATPAVRQATNAPLSDRPLPHKFFDRQQLLALYLHSGMRAVDTIKTCRELSHGGREDWIPTQSCGGIAAWQVGSIGLALGVGWMFHKHGNHRLERITPWVATGASAAGWTKSVFNIK